MGAVTEQLTGWTRNFAPLCLSSSWAQLFKGRLALNSGLDLTQVSFSYVLKLFLR